MPRYYVWFMYRCYVWFIIIVIVYYWYQIIWYYVWFMYRCYVWFIVIVIVCYWYQIIWYMVYWRYIIKSYDIWCNIIILSILIFVIKSCYISCTEGMLSNHILFGVKLSFLSLLLLFLLSNHVIFRVTGGLAFWELLVRVMNNIWEGIFFQYIVHDSHIL